jgi:acyl-CoA reductase-like NAD-dependent aldehyde dehydrogenase
MELGGKSANIILNDADLTIAVDGALYAFLYHSGQACDSGTRLLVQEEIYPEFMEKFLKRIKEVKVAPTSDPAAGYGPVISEKQMNTILGFIEKTKKEDGKLLSGGSRLTDGEFSKGFFIEPTAFEVNPGHTIFQEEIFGPVVGITKFKTDEEAVALANNSKYGLAGAVWSRDNERAHKIASQLEAGTVWVNEYHLLNPGMPFGGFKESGLGREMGPEGIMSYLEVRHVWISDCNEREKKVWLDAIF